MTVARSDYGHYLPVLRKIQADPALKLHLIAGGMHLSPEYGMTAQVIEKDALRAHGMNGTFEGAVSHPMGFALHPRKYLAGLLGAAEAGLLTYMRARFVGWPFHPAAVAFPVRLYGFSPLLVWLAKSIVLRYGGVRLYRGSLPFCYGIIVGYLVGVGLSTLVDAIGFRGRDTGYTGGERL